MLLVAVAEEGRRGGKCALQAKMDLLPTCSGRRRLASIGLGLGWKERELLQWGEGECRMPGKQ